MATASDDAHDPIEVELIQSLFENFAPSVLMSAMFVGSVLASWRFLDPALLGLAACGILASGIRLSVVLCCRKEARSRSLQLGRAALLERRFAVSFIAFAVVLGLFGTRLISRGAAETHMLTICLLVGYSAGVAVGVGLRPRIAIPSMIAAVVPTAVTLSLWGEPIYVVTSLVLLTFLAGGSYSVLVRHRATKRELGQKKTFAGMARIDPLTALPNRLALREWFETHVTHERRDRLVAVHYLDLNGFKPVNDRFGHPAGDELLRAVAARLARIVRGRDIVARLGGDEFAVVQASLRHENEAELLAKRMCRAIEAPFSLDGRVITISTCIGYVTSTEQSADLEKLLPLADEALYSAKNSKGDVVRFVESPEYTIGIAA